MSKRKLDEAADVSGLSAFAARRQLLTSSTQAATEDGAGPSLQAQNIDDQSKGQRGKGSEDAFGRHRATSPCSSETSFESHDFSPATIEVATDESAHIDSSLDARLRHSLERPIARLSTYRPTPHNVLQNTRDRLQLRLPPGETLAILGQYDLRVRRGMISLLGATLLPSERLSRVYAPSTHALPVIAALSQDDTPALEAEIEIIACNSGIRRLQRISPLFSRLWNEKTRGTGWPVGTADAGRRSFTPIIQAADDRLRRTLRPTVLHQSWLSAVSDLSRRYEVEPLTALICGSKSSGKSTFMRQLINTILSTSTRQDMNATSSTADGCALLDLHSGQPEFLPPGMISLVQVTRPIFGQAFTNHCGGLRDGDQLIRAHHVTGTSTKADPFHFRACVNDLLKSYREHLPALPLIVNCPGWIEGTELEILVQSIRDIRPTDIVFLSSITAPHILGILEDARGAATWHELEPQTPMTQSRGSHQLTTMQTLSYFHLTKPKHGCLQWDAACLTSRRPLVVRYHGQNPGVYGIMVPGDVLLKDQLVKVLEGSVVAVVALEEDSNPPHTGGPNTSVSSMNEYTNGWTDEVPDDDDDAESIVATSATTIHERRTLTPTPEKLPYLCNLTDNIPLDPSRSHCLGLAIVRGIDVSRHELQLLTPISTQAVNALLKRQTKVVLVCGALDTPSWVYTEDLAVQGWRSRQEKRDDHLREGRGGELAQQLRTHMREQLPWVTPVRLEQGDTSKP